MTGIQPVFYFTIRLANPMVLPELNDGKEKRTAKKQFFFVMTGFRTSAYNGVGRELAAGLVSGVSIGIRSPMYR
jgi:hypothetical protein